MRDTHLTSCSKFLAVWVLHYVIRVCVYRIDKRCVDGYLLIKVAMPPFLLGEDLFADFCHKRLVGAQFFFADGGGEPLMFAIFSVVCSAGSAVCLSAYCWVLGFKEGGLSACHF